MTFIPADDGTWVDENFERMARIVRDYDHNLVFCWIPPAQRTGAEASRPYVILDTLHKTAEWPMGSPVIYATELDTPEGILERLFAADNKHGNVLNKMETHNAAVEAMRLKKIDDRYAEMADEAEFLMKRAGNYVKAGKDADGKQIKLDDQRRRI